MMIDSHAHLEMDEFNEDRDNVVERARAAGLVAVIVVGTSVPDSAKAVEMIGIYDLVYASVGVHPHEVKDIDATTYDSLRVLAQRNKVVAIGEIGLDFYYNHSPRELQFQHFAEQLDLAIELELPVIIHDREAHAETLEFLGQRKGRLRGVLHCFSGDRRMAKKCLDLGFYLSIAGPVTYKKSEELREVARYLPADALLVETDSPYLAPEPFRGKRNEPAFVVETAQRVAEIRGITIEELEAATERNTRQLFAF
ncbi:MAG: TatD family hydrolase [Syntrophobacterales bacterium]|nr:TatD family hydrolase [Syntrophobacterales bacterium]